MKELVITAKSERKGNDALDSTTGKLLDLPKEYDGWSARQQFDWVEKNGIDLLVDIVASDGKTSYQLKTEPFGLKLAAIDPQSWDAPANEQIQAALASRRPDLLNGKQIAMVYEEEEKLDGGSTDAIFELLAKPPLTFAFETRKGAQGLLQILHYTEEPHGMRIRYTLVQPVKTEKIQKNLTDGLF